MSVVAALDGVAALVLLVLVCLIVLVLRRRVLSRQGGTFDCSMRLKASTQGRGWALGIGRYAGDSLEWYRVFSLAARPRRVLVRRDLEIVDRRAPSGPEVFSLLANAVVVRARHGAGSVEFAMSPEALTGFLSWLESAPPGRAG